MSAATMWAAMQAAIAAVTPYQGNDPVASASYRAAVGQAMCTAIISEQNTPVAWDGTNDRVLDVGQFTSDSFSAQTSMPLHIACGDGQEYEISMVGTYTPATAAAADSYLQPNNVVPATNSFTLRGQFTAGTTVTGIGAAYVTGGFDLLAGGSAVEECKVTIFTSTLNKKAIVQSGGATSTNSNATAWTCRWNDTTTVWSSLGTVIQPNAWTGQIVCRRIA